MNKKWQIVIVVVAVAVIYLGLLVGIPALADMIGPCGSCNETETAGNVPAVLDSEGIELNKPLWGALKMPWPIYLVPGLAGGAVIATILKQKKEVHLEENS